MDEVWWVPVAAHPFAKPVTPFATRLGLCRAAVADLPWVRIEPIEADLPSPSYTIHTLEALAARHPGHAFRLVVGADVLAETDRWREWDAIAARFAPIAVGRAGYPTPPGAVDFPPISSTAIRARVAAGEAVDALVPASILARVRELYRTS